MTTPGFQDYARVSQQQSQILATASRAFPSTSIVFQGYIGDFAFINAFWEKLSGTDFFYVTYNYFPDSSFGTVIAQVNSVRSSACQAFRQYTALTPWLQIKVQPISGGDSNFANVTFCATNQYSPSFGLADTANPLFTFNNAAYPNGSTTQSILQIVPGNAYLTFSISNINVSLQLQYFTPSLWIQFLQVYGGEGTEQTLTPIALPDAPIRAVLSNSSGAAVQLNASITTGT